MNRLVFVAVSLLLVVHNLAAEAARYQVTVTRRDSNLYESRTPAAIVQTRYCYEYVYSEDAILDWDGYSGFIVFLDQANKCDVKNVALKQALKEGKYSIQVSRDDDNWYEVFGTNIFLKTSLCLELALADDAILNWQGFGGDLIFINGNDRCTVESVWSKAK